MQRLRFKQQRRPEVHVRLHALAVEHAARELHAAAVGTEAVRKILQRTLAALVAHRAIERMIQKKELEHARARLLDLRRVGRDDHPVGADRRARGLQLRHLLDADDADAAGAVNAKARVIAVVGDRAAVLVGRLEDGLALLDRDLLAVYRQRDGVHIHGIISVPAFHVPRSGSVPRSDGPKFEVRAGRPVTF